MFQRMHCVKSVEILGLNTGKYEAEKTPYLDTFYAVMHLVAGLFFPVIETAIGIYLRS